jgi:cytochrome c
LKILAFIFFSIAALPCCLSTKEVQERADNLFTEDDYNAGFELVQQSDCRTCHQLKEKNIGPPFLAIAIRYEKVTVSVFEKLSNRIRNGGVGTWGEIPMPWHPSVTKEKADAITKYILLIKYK